MALGRQTRGDWPQRLLSWGLVGPGARSGPTSPLTSQTRERKPGVHRARGKQSCCFLLAVCYLGGLPDRFSSVRFFFLMKSFPGSCRNAMSRALRVTNNGPGLHPVSGLQSHICAPVGEARPLPRLGLHGPQ